MKYWTIDVFTNKAFTGNAAGVFLCQEKLAEDVYKKLSLELFQAETAFIQAVSNLSGHYNIRFFSPYQEQKISSHSLYAAAHVLWTEENIDAKTPLYFESSEGVHKITKEEDFISITFQKPQIHGVASPDRLFNALGTLPVSIKQCGRNLIVELHTEEELGNLTPDFGKLSNIDIDRFIVTCEENTEKYDYINRVFAPRLGNDEEAANIQSHCDLGAFWGKRTEKNELKAKQIGHRPGRLLVKLSENTITLLGQCTTVISGKFRIKL